MKKETQKKIIHHLITAIFLIAVIYFVFHDYYHEILLSISKLSFSDIVVLIVMSCGYLALDSAAYYVMVSSQFPHFTYQKAIEITLLGIFTNVSTSTAGTLPIQSYYLYKQGINIGSSMSFMILESVFHKLSVFLYALFVFLFNRKWLVGNIPRTVKYIDLGFVIYAFIIIGLVMLCTWKKIQKILLQLIQKLPDKDKWKKRKQRMTQYIQALYDESHKVIKNYQCCLKVLFFNFLKLLLILSVPYITILMLKIDGLTFLQTQILSSLIFIIVGVLPNIAGIGPTELAFLLLFSPFITQVQSTSLLIVFRLVEYFIPFLLSIKTFIKLKNDFMNKHIE